MRSRSVWPIIVATLALAAGSGAPNRALLAAAVDQDDLARAGHATDLPYIRYLALFSVPAAERPALLDALTLWANSLSFEPNFGALVLTDDKDLLRLDLRAFGWDRPARAARLARLEARGIALRFRDRALFEDVWEELVVDGKEPYFKVSHATASGYVFEGWLDPVVEAEVRRLSRSRSAVIRADWFLAKTAWDKGVNGFTGFYSDVLMLPPLEKDLFLVLGVDRKFAKDELTIRGGGSISRGVAIHNRELQRFPGQLGLDRTFLWRSLDVADEGRGKVVLEVFAGTLKRDGSEHIFSLPNGLHGYYACNAAGAQVGEVPINIAQDRGDSYDTRVIAGYKCAACHGPGPGILDFTDVVGQAAVGRDDVALTPIVQDPKAADRVRRELDAYYFGGLDRQADGDRDSYAARVTELTGRQPGAATSNFKSWVDRYAFNYLDHGQAAREFGVPEADLVPLLHESGDSTLRAFAVTKQISREVFERSFRAGIRVIPKPWDRASVPEKGKVVSP
jgi:hypothetical protein